MIKIGNEYIFNFRIEDNCTNEDDIELCVHNSGLNCKVIEYVATNEHGNLYEVESCTGSQFFAYDCELDELKEKDIRYWHECGFDKV